jgi:hypothetical protein
MSKKARSNSPQALSVASITEPGNVALTVDRMLEFDDARIGFTHAHTWSAMPVALRGVIEPSSSSLVYPGTHPRVEACIRALCELGKRGPVDAKRFEDYPRSGLTTNRVIEWGPGISISVKAVCWYIRNNVPIIPLLQPRKIPLGEGALSFYATLGAQAYANGDWVKAQVGLVDLSGDDEVYANMIPATELHRLSDPQVAQYVKTYLEAKVRADEIRASRPKPAPKPKGDDLFDTLI